MILFHIPEAMNQNKPDDSIFKVNIKIPDVHLVSDMVSDMTSMSCHLVSDMTSMCCLRDQPFENYEL